MSTPNPRHFECKAGRGDLDLYYKDEWVAIDITERRHRDRKVYTEVFLDADDLDRLLAELALMRDTVRARADAAHKTTENKEK